MDKKLENYLSVECFEGKKLQWFQLIKRIRSVPQYRAIYLIRKMQFSNSVRKKRYYSNLLIKEFGIFCGFETKIGIGLKLPHPNGIVLGNGVKIGEYVTIYQQVTIGSAHIGDWKDAKQPIIGSDSVIFSGAKVIGNIVLAEKTIVGANAVLNKSTSKESVWGGIPAMRLDCLRN